MDKNAVVGLGMMCLSLVCVAGLLTGHDGVMLIATVGSITGVCGWVLGRKRL